MEAKPSEKPGVEPSADESVLDDSELETAGTETEDDLGDAEKIDFRDVVLAPSDWTVQTILSQLNADSFELDPDFQRRNAWTDSRRSKFIESLFLGLPIPQIVLAEKELETGEDKYIVIDGKQRLLALESFHSSEDPLVLSQLTVLKDLNGKTRDEILDNPATRKLVTRLDNRTIRTVVIRKWNDDSFLHLVFHRINHQTLSLSAQELRQALNPGPFTRFADAFAGRSDQLHRALGASQQPDFRMRDVELLVRHLAYRYALDTYQGNLKRFLDEACKSFNISWPKEGDAIQRAAKDCDEAILATYEIFQDKAFRRFTRPSNWENRFNRAVFDVMTYYFSSPEIRTAALAHGPAVVEAFLKLSLEDDTFSASLASTTKTTHATAYRLSAWGNSLSDVLDVKFSKPMFLQDTRRITIVDESAG